MSGWHVGNVMAFLLASRHLLEGMVVKRFMNKS
jgi:hypothetical protein